MKLAFLIWLDEDKQKTKKMRGWSEEEETLGWKWRKFIPKALCVLSLQYVCHEKRANPSIIRNCGRVLESARNGQLLEGMNTILELILCNSVNISLLHIVSGLYSAPVQVDCSLVNDCHSSHVMVYDMCIIFWIFIIPCYAILYIVMWYLDSPISDVLLFLWSL
jgi:hypothetical protein